MNRFTLYLFGFLLLAQANAFALNCDLSKFKLGKNISNFEKEKIASHERLEGAKLGAQATHQKQKEESDKVIQGIKLGMDAEFKKKEFNLKEKDQQKPKE